MEVNIMKPKSFSSLSSFYQKRFNSFMIELMIKRFGWKMTFTYMKLLGEFYHFLLNRKSKLEIIKVIDMVNSKKKVNLKIIKKVMNGVYAHYYEKFFNIYSNFKRLEIFFENSIEAGYLYKLDNAISEGRGVMLITAHFGGIEYIPLFLALKQYPITVVAKFHSQKLKNQSFSRVEKLGMEIIDAGEGGTLNSIIKELRRNRIVFFECDEPKKWKPSEKDRIEFLGNEIFCDRTINIIQNRTNAEIIFCILHRFNLQNYNLIIESYQDLVSEISGKNNSIGAIVLKRLEKMILSDPDNYYNWHELNRICNFTSENILLERFIPLSALISSFRKNLYRFNEILKDIMVSGFLKSIKPTRY